MICTLLCSSVFSLVVLTIGVILIKQGITLDNQGKDIFKEELKRTRLITDVLKSLERRVEKLEKGNNNDK